ncbi:TBC1 domain family member 20 [Chlorella vulgaris]
MARSRRGRRPPSAAADRDAATVQAVNALLLEPRSPAVLTRLRKIAAIRGLVTDGLRARVWPLLLGVEVTAEDAAQYQALQGSTHKDSAVVACDIARSLWSFTDGWSDAEREAKRAALRHVVDAAVAGNKAGLFYYQGLHDIAAVLLFVCGELPACRLLRALAEGHLRDCTRPDLAAATETLRLLYPILEQCDPELYRYLIWYMTWFAHDVPSQHQIARLFDLFLASHPLMPLYLAAGNRRDILACGDDGLAVYSVLKKMRFLQPGQPDADELAREAAALYQAIPPRWLARRRKIQLHQATAIDAYLGEGRWVVPAEPRGNRSQFGQQVVGQLQALFVQPRQGAALAAFVTSLTGLAAVGALLLAQMQTAQWGR